MRTDHLIAVLSQDQIAPLSIKARVLCYTGMALLLAGLIVQTLLGWRPALIPAMQNPVTAMKWLLPLAVAIPAISACFAMTNPQTRRTPVIWVAAIVAAIVVLWFATSAMQSPPELLWTQIRGSTIGRCMLSIIAISVLPLGAAFWWLREGASPAPTYSGALIGLAVGGISAAIYASFCDEDAPLFFLTWYSFAILTVTLVGALLGKRFLRW